MLFSCVTAHGPSWITVTACTRPEVSPTWVMPSFLPINPVNTALLELDFNVDARGEVELAQRVDRLLGRLEHVEQAFMRTNFKMLTRLLVDMWRTIHGEALDPGRQRNRPRHPAARAPYRIHDFAHRLVEQPMVVRLEAYPNFIVHPVSHVPDSRSGPFDLVAGYHAGQSANRPAQTAPAPPVYFMIEAPDGASIANLTLA